MNENSTFLEIWSLLITFKMPKTLFTFENVNEIFFDVLNQRLLSDFLNTHEKDKHLFELSRLSQKTEPVLANSSKRDFIFHGDQKVREYIEQSIENGLMGKIRTLLTSIKSIDFKSIEEKNNLNLKIFYLLYLIASEASSKEFLVQSDFITSLEKAANLFEVDLYSNHKPSPEDELIDKRTRATVGKILAIIFSSANPKLIQLSTLPSLLIVRSVILCLHEDKSSLLNFLSLRALTNFSSYKEETFSRVLERETIKRDILNDCKLVLCSDEPVVIVAALECLNNLMMCQGYVESLVMKYGKAKEQETKSVLEDEKSMVDVIGCKNRPDDSKLTDGTQTDAHEENRSVGLADIASILLYNTLEESKIEGLFERFEKKQGINSPEKSSPSLESSQDDLLKECLKFFYIIEKFITFMIKAGEKKSLGEFVDLLIQKKYQERAKDILSSLRVLREFQKQQSCEHYYLLNSTLSIFGLK